MESWLPTDYINRSLQDIQSANTNHTIGQQTDPGTVLSLNSISHFFPWVSSGTALGLAKSGYNAYSPETMKAAQLEITKQLRDRQFQKLIENNDKGTLAKLSPAELNSFTPQQRKQLAQSETQNAGGGGGLFGTGVGPDFSLGDFTDTLPVVGSVKALTEGKGIEEALTRAIPGQQLVAKLESQGGSGIQNVAQGTPIAPVGNVVAGVARTAGLAAAAPLQYVQGTVRNKATAISNVVQGNGSVGDVLSAGDPTGAIGQIENAGDTYKQTQAGQAAIALAQGRTVDVGTGLLPDANSATGQAAAKAARAASPQSGMFSPEALGTTYGGQLHPHAFTLGRGLAALMTLSPGSNAFNFISGVTDATVSMKADPTSTFLGEYSEARRNGKLINATGDIGQEALDKTGAIASTANPTTDPGKTENFITSEKVHPTLQNLTDQHSPSTIWNMGTARDAQGRTIRNSFSIPFAVAAADSTSNEETLQLIRDHASEFQGPINMPTPGNPGYMLRNGAQNSVFGRLMPGDTHLQVQNPEQILQQLDDVMGGMHGLDPAVRTKILDDFMRDSMDPTKDARILARDQVGKVLYQGMVNAGTKPELAARVVDAFTDGQSKMYGVIDTRVGSTTPRSDTLTVGQPGGVDPDNVPVAPDEDLADFNHNLIPLPNPRQIRRLTGQWAEIMQHPLYQNSVAVLDQVLNVWKGTHLARMALGLKVVLDSQLSMAANGYNSAFHHPVGYIGDLIASNPDAPFSQFARRVTSGLQSTHLLPAEFSLPTDVSATGGSVNDIANFELQQQLYNSKLQTMSPDKVVLGGKGTVPTRSFDGPRGMVTDIAALNQDPVASQIVGMTREQAYDWFINGDGADLRRRMAPTINNQNFSRTQFGGGTKGVLFNIDDGNETGAKAFIDNVFDHIDNKTAGHPKLLEAVRTGRINFSRRTPLYRMGALNEHAANQMKLLINEAADSDNTIHVPEEVTAPSSLFNTRTQVTANTSILNNAFTSFFNHILTLPDVYFNRNPVLRQNYWGSIDRAGEIQRAIPFLESEEARQTLLTNARAAGLPAPVIRRLEAVQVDPNTAHPLTLDQADLGAKARSIDTVAKVVHDLHSRSQFFDAARMIFPFGDAFRRIAVRWAKTSWDNPVVLRRVQQGILAANQSGFFHKDAQGNEVFSYPGADWITDKMTGALSSVSGALGGPDPGGIPIPLSGTPQDLSMLGGGYPGVGPAVTLPASFLIKDTPGLPHDFHQLIYPKGEAPPSAAGIGGDIINALIPSYANKIIQGLFNRYPDQKAYNDTVGAMLNFKASSGEYDLHGDHAAAETARLLQDSKDAARFWYMVRGFSQMATPGSQTPEYQVHDKTGHLQILDVVKKDYNEHLVAHGVDAALTWLFDKYGTNNFFIAQPFSAPIAYAAPTTKTGQDWFMNNPTLVKKFPDVAGLFAPQGDKKFDIGAFEQQFATGQRKTLTAEDSPITGSGQVTLANSRVGLWIYHKMRDDIIRANSGKAPTTLQAVWLSNLKDELAKRYPGFQLAVYDTTRLPRGITQLEAAAKDPTLAKTDAGQGLNMYLQIRKMAMDGAVSGLHLTSPNSVFTAQSALPLREWLRNMADEIIREHPEFSPMFEQLFAHEMAYDPTVGR